VDANAFWTREAPLLTEAEARERLESAESWSVDHG